MIKPKIRFCKDCKYCDLKDESYPFCTHPLQHYKADPVLGAKMVLAINARSTSMGACGPDGTLWESKEKVHRFLSINFKR